MNARRVKRDLLTGIVHMDVHDVDGLASLVERIQLRPHVKYRALNVAIFLLLVEIIEADLAAKLLVPDAAHLVLILVEINVVVHDVEVDWFDFHG